MLRRWLGQSVAPSKRRARRPGRRPIFRPCCEPLESRLAPAGGLSIANPMPLPEGDSGTSAMLFVVNRSGDTAAPLDVPYATADGTAHAGIDYQAQSGTLHFAANQTTATVAVAVIGNTLVQDNRTFTVNLSVPLQPAQNTLPPDTMPPNFTPQQPAVTGAGPYAVALGDVNGDGRLDLAVANANDDTVSVLLNTTAPGGPITFAAQQTFATGHSPRSVVLADVNGDGRPDLVVANANDDTVSVLLNTTAPGAAASSFAPRVDFLVGNCPDSVAVADVNGDSRPDLVVVNRYSFNVMVLENITTQGADVPRFTPPQTFAVGLEPVSVAVGDFNGDGRPDLAVANLSDDTVSVLLNTTAQGADEFRFAAQQTFATGGAPTAVAVGDFNGDGRGDLAVSNFSDGTVSVFVNTTAPGAATLSLAPKVDFATGAGPYAVAVSNFSGAGFPDLAVVDYTDDTVSVLRNTTAPGAAVPRFAPRVAFGTGAGPLALAVGDLNGDGLPDLTAADFSAATASVLLNTPTTATGTIQDDDAPASLTAVAGTTPQTAAFNTAFGEPLAVDVRNAAGHLVQGASVTFTAPAGAGVASGTFPGDAGSVTVTTDASGRAAAPTFTANAVAGTYTATATAIGANNPLADFSLTNVAYVAPTVKQFRVLFGSQSYDLLGSPRTTDLPWTISSVQVEFSTPVTGTANSLPLSGVGGPLAVSGLTGSGTTTLTWTLASPINLDLVSGQLLASGSDGIQDLAGHFLNYGTRFPQQFNVLYGDFDDDGQVTLTGDAGGIADIYYHGGYNRFADLDGDGVVGLTDIAIAFIRAGDHLPGFAPASAAPGAPLQGPGAPSQPFKDLGTLRLYASSFTQDNTNPDTYSASGTITVGLAPTEGEAFTSLVTINGTVGFTLGTSDPTLTVTDATIDAVVQGTPVIPLWQTTGSTTFDVQQLTTTGVSLGTNGQLFQVSYVNFMPTSLRFFNPGGGSTTDAQVELQGNLAITELPGLSLPVAGNTYVVLDTTGVNMTDFTTTVTTPFSVLDLGITPTGMTVAYSGNNGSFSFSGNMTVSTSDGGLNQAAANFGTPTEPGLVVQSGVVNQVNIGLPNDFTLFGLPVHPQNMSFQFDGTRQQFVIYGSATLPVHGKGTSPLPGNFGTADSPGATIANGKFLGVTIIVSGTFSLGGVPWQADDATLQYQPSGDQYQLTGSISLPYLLAVTSTLGDGSAKHPALTIKDGSVQVDGFAIAFNDIYLGAFVVDNLTLTYNGHDADTAFKATFNLWFPGNIRAGGTIAFDENGHLSGLGVSYSQPQGIEILDTGIFLNGLSATVLNFNDPANLIVSGSVTLTYGGQWDIAGKQVTLLRAIGSFTVDKNMLQLGGDVYLGAYSTPFSTVGLLAHGSGQITLNWGQQDYKGDLSFTWAEGLFKVHAGFDLSHGGKDLYVRADADVDVPDFIPFIGGDSIAGLDFALEYHADLPSSDSFAAAWTHVDLLFSSFDIGFKVDFNGDVSVIGNDEVDAINNGNDNPTPQVYRYYASFVAPLGATYGTLGMSWPAAAGTQSIAVLPPGGSTPIDEGEFNPNTNGLALVPQYSSPNTPNAKTVHVVGDVNDPNKPLPAGVYQLILTSTSKLVSAPTFKGVFGYPKPTISVGDLPPDPTGTVPVPLTTSVDEGFASLTRISLFADSNNSGYNGTPIPGLVNVPYQSNPTLTWDPAGLLPLPYYVYAVINDGTNTPVYSAYSQAVTPIPALSGIVADPKNGGKPLSGFTVYLDDNHNGQFDPGSDPSTTTGPSGFYAFNPPQLPVNQPVDVGVVIPRGFQLDPASQDPIQRTYDGTEPVTADFGLDELASIEGTVFDDQNRNGRLDPGEPGRPGWTVYLDANGNGRPDAGEVTITTGPDGHYTFYDVGLNAAYTVGVVLPSGTFQTGPLPVPPGTYTTTVGSDRFQHITGLDFGTLKLPTISGTIAGNQLANGQIDPTTTPLNGWTVQLLEGDTVIATTTTAADGTYSFANVLPGTYTVKEVVPAGWRETSPFQADLKFSPGILDFVSNNTPGNPAVPATSITTGDFDNDGHIDFATPWVVGNPPSSAGVNVFFNFRGNGGLWSAISLGVSFTDVYQVIALDSQGTGRTDLAVISNGGQVDLLVNEGNKNFSLSSGYFRLPDGANLSDSQHPGYLIKGDFDNDQRDDLAVSYFNTQDQRYHLAILQSGSRQVLDQAYPNLGTLGGGLAAGDFNGDGKLDLLLNGGAPNGDDGPTVAYNQGGGVFTQPFTEVNNLIGGVGGAAGVGDINGDGLPDGVTVANSGFAAGYSWILLNNQSGGLSLGSNLPPPANQTGARRVILADLAGGLKDDLVIFQGGNPWLVYTNQGKAPYFQSGTGIPFNNTFGDPADIAVADVNGDGFLDLLVADAQKNGTYIFLNQSVVNQTTITVNAVLDQDAPNNDFTNTQLGQVRGRVFEDVNQDAQEQTEEPGHAGATVYVDFNRNGRLDANEPTSVTGADGGYFFVGLPDGTYQVRVADEPGRMLTTNPAGFAEVVVGSGRPPVTGLDFGTIADVTPPTSGIAGLPAVSDSASFTVTWSGTDGQPGSGIALFQVYVSDNGGAYTLWNQSAAAGSAAFTGQNGHTYSFYSVATDHAGNRQPTPNGAQAATEVVLGGTPPIVISPTRLRPAQVGHAYRKAISARRTVRHRFRIAGGSLPPGVRLNPRTGVLAGIPREPGTFQFVVRVTQSGGGTKRFSTSQSFTLDVRQGAPARLVFLTQPSGAPVGGFLDPIQVLVLDKFGNRVSGKVVRQVLVPIADPRPAGTTPANVAPAMAVNGVATFSRVTVPAPGRYRMQARVGVIEVFSKPFDVG
jgi:hypothetical protein